MTPLSTAVGASVLAHGLHYAMVLAGLWGLAALLLPHALTRLLGTPPPPDDHDRRVAALRAAVGGAVGGAVGASGASRLAALAPQAPDALAPQPPGARVWSVPLAVVATCAAAGIHAAVAPPHLRESATAGAFFLIVALTQLAWAVAAQHPTRSLLRAGVLLHAGLVALWLLTRTTGLPFGWLPDRHPVGAWDVACVVWEVVAATACARVLHEAPRDGARHGVLASCPGWFAWHPMVRSAVGAAAASLVLLSLVGGHS